MKKTLLIALTLALGSTASSHAMTLADVLQQHQVYKSTPAVLGATTPGVTPASYPVAEGGVILKGLKYTANGGPLIAKTLTAGMSNSDDVKKLQLFLIAKGYLNADPTGSYGPLTKAAVKKFQATQGINSDGSVVGPATKAAMMKIVEETGK